MSHSIVTLAGKPVLVCEPEGPAFAAVGEVVDLIGDAYAADAKVVALPLGRLPEGFLELKTRIAGEVLQKFVNYGFQVALVGDISAEVAKSGALTDFVRESNRGKTVWFVADLADLEARLTAAA